MRISSGDNLRGVLLKHEFNPLPGTGCAVQQTNEPNDQAMLEEGTL